MKRAAVWELREAVRAHPSADPRTKHCGKTRYQRHVELQRSEDGAAGWYQGVVRCRTRTCPVCWIARRHKIAREIDHVVTARTAQTQCAGALATLTVRHHKGHHVRLAKDVRMCWRYLLQSRAWRTFKKQNGVECIIAEEVTLGPNGWHPHMHILLLPNRELAVANPWDLAGAWFEQWRRIVARKLGKEHEPTREHGVDLQKCDSGGYLSKLGLELSDPRGVKGRSPLAMLAEGQLDEYMTLQNSRRRARDITFSRGLRALRDSLPPPTDPVVVAHLVGSDWGRLTRNGLDVALDISEKAGDASVVRARLAQELGGAAESYDPREYAENSAVLVDDLGGNEWNVT